MRATLCHATRSYSAGWRNHSAWFVRKDGKPSVAPRGKAAVWTGPEQLFRTHPGFMNQNTEKKLLSFEKQHRQDMGSSSCFLALSLTAASSVCLTVLLQSALTVCRVGPSQRGQRSLQGGRVDATLVGCIRAESALFRRTR